MKKEIAMPSVKTTETKKESSIETKKRWAVQTTEGLLIDPRNNKVGLFEHKEDADILQSIVSPESNVILVTVTVEITIEI